VLEAALSGLVNTMSRKVLIRFSHFAKLTPMMFYGTKINALNFGVNRSQLKVTME